MGDTGEIVDALLDTTKRQIETFCDVRLNNGMSAYELVEALSKGLQEIGEGYRERYFDAELMVSGWNAKKALEIIKPLLHEGGRGEAEGTLGKIVIGTVKGDVHDIGKEILMIMLSAAGFEVIDLGIDVDKETFAGAVKETGAKILALSALLTTTREYMAEVTAYLRSSGLKVKIMVGGGAVNAAYADSIGADAYGRDAIEAVKKAKELLG